VTHGGHPGAFPAPRKRPPAETARGRFVIWAAVTLLLPLMLGCAASRPKDGSYAVGSIQLEGTRALGSDELSEQLATTASSKFLGIESLQGFVFDYSLLDEDVLRKDVERVERYYRLRGYYEAKVTVARIERDEARRTTHVTIRVDEGAPVLVRRVVPSGLEMLPSAVAFQAQRAIVLIDGQPFDEDKYEQSRRGVLEVLADHGLPFAKLEGRVNVDVSHHRADISLHVEPGVSAVYGESTIQGLERLPEGVVRRTLGLRPGAPYSKAEIREAENALVNLGVFSSVSVQPMPLDTSHSVVPLRVTVRESPLRTVRAGFGVRVDEVQVTTTLRLGWEHRNFLGRLRRLSIDTRPSLSLYPTRTKLLRWPTRVLPANRLRAELRQPSFVEGRTTGLVSTEYNIYPLLFPLPANKNPRDERILGYHEFRSTIGLERSFFDLRLQVTPSFSYQANVPLSYQSPPGAPGLPQGLNTLAIAYPELIVSLDLRDDRIRPRKGILVSNSLQAALHSMGSDVSDLRLRPELRTYLPVSRSSVLATRLTLGFLLPRNYGQTLNDPARIASNPTDPGVIADQQRLLFRAFYSGGPNSNRGYATSEVGPHGPLGLLSDGPVNCFATPGDPDCVRPLGGLTLWEASTEVRIDLGRAVGAVLFVDASDVTRKRFGMRLSVPHLSPGIGLRYDTLIGPFRLDLGYRLLERTGAAPPQGPIRDQAETRGWFGSRWLPLSLHLALGEAF
jgi:outer membrane protein assembly factor BamA